MISLENWFDHEVDKKIIVLKATVDRTTSELVKELKHTLKGVIPSKPMQVPILKMSNSERPRGTASSSFTQGSRSSMANSTYNNLASNDDRTELDLFLFNTGAKNLMLAFTRLLPTDYPLRMLKGNGATCCLVYVSIHQIERYLIHMNSLKIAVPESNPVTQLSKLILNNSK